MGQTPRAAGRHDPICLYEYVILPSFTLFTTGASNVTVSDGQSLSGFTQGDGSHLLGTTLTLGSNTRDVVQVFDSNDSDFSDSDNSQTLDGPQTYDGVSYAGGLRVEAEYTLTVQDPDGNTFTLIGFNINEPGATSFSTIEGLAFIGPVGGFPPAGVPLEVISTSEGPSAGSTPFSDFATPPCFTPGTRLATPGGDTRIADLSVGDLVETRDNGPQPILWIGRTTVTRQDLRDQPRLRPILIERDAFGPGRPSRRMRVSPMHRILKADRAAAMLFDSSEVLIAAKHLTGVPGIARDDAADQVTYVHIAFADHQIVCSDGLWTESLLPTDAATSALHPDAKAELMALFGPLTGPQAPLAARTCLKAFEAQVLLTA